ncbi:MAG: MBL fold metallo-hydrolase [Planctomycetota bacterium]
MFLPAATVVAVRPAPGGCEVALLQRNPRLRFLGGFWVFPGGRADPGEDLALAALREALEEAALALVPGGDALSLPRRRALQDALLDERAPLGAALASAGLAADPSRLLPCGRWKTPPFGPERYDTRFFLAAVEPGCELAIHAGDPATPEPDGELVAAAWLRPEDLLARWARDEALLAPPTRVTLEALAAQAAGLFAPGGLARASAAIAAAHPADGEWTGFIDFRPGLRLLPVRTPTLPPATHTNCLVVGCGSEVVVIDPASPYPEERAALDARLDELAAAGQRVREVLLTHHHHDHCSGAEHLADRLGVPIAAHARTWARLEGRVRVDRPLEDGETIELPADLPGARPRRLRAILTEGHADGHLIYLEEVTRSLIAGDLVAGVGTIVVDPPEGRLGDYLASLRRAAALDAALLYPSHGPPIGDPRAYCEHYVAHRLEREAKLLTALRELGPCPVEDLLPRAYDDKPPSVYPLAARAALAHLIKLEEDGVAARDAEVWSLLP